MNDGKKKKTQKHQNKTKFKIVYDTAALQNQKKVSFHGLCVRCTEQIKWKLQYNKYKKMSEPSRCTFCGLKTVYRSYMKVCEPCAKQKKVCQKCLEADYKPGEQRLTQKQRLKNEENEEKRMNDYITTLRERSRRTIKREYEKGTIFWDNQIEEFIDKDGKPLEGLHFRAGYGDKEDILEEQISDEDLEQDFGDIDEE